jgi:hypothetical protein
MALFGENDFQKWCNILLFRLYESSGLTLVCIIWQAVTVIKTNLRGRFLDLWARTRKITNQKNGSI